MNTDAEYRVDMSRLPQPFLGRHTEWTDLYRFAWRLAARHIRRSRGRLHMDAATSVLSPLLHSKMTDGRWSRIFAIST